MNELDDATFARFATRFSRIEQQVPEPPPHNLSSAMGSRGLRPLSLFASLVGVVILLVAAVGLAVIRSPAAVTIPPDSAPPAVVLDAYLRALQAGDCDAASELTIPRLFGASMVDLCDVTGVTAFSVLGDPVVVDPDTVRMRASLAITGTDHGLAAGEITFTYFLQQQPTGAWRIVDGAPHIPPSMIPLPTPLT
jgi:hypothetical protein